MIVTDYQVKIGVRTYSKQLQRSKLCAKLDASGNDPKQMLSENISISEEGRRRLVVGQQASQVKEPTETANADDHKP